MRASVMSAIQQRLYAGKSNLHRRHPQPVTVAVRVVEGAVRGSPAAAPPGVASCALLTGTPNPAGSSAALQAPRRTEAGSGVADRR